MIFALLIIALISLFKSEIKKDELFNEDYMSIEKTTPIKGIFVILVFLRHLGGNLIILNKYDKALFYFQDFWGQTIVVMFLFYSGYGIYESIKSKKAYISNMPKTRILTTLINYDLAVIMFIILNAYMGHHFSLWITFSSFFAWNNIGNSNWFIFSILISYIITFICFKQ